MGDDREGGTTLVNCRSLRVDKKEKVPVGNCPGVLHRTRLEIRNGDKVHLSKYVGRLKVRFLIEQDFAVCIERVLQCTGFTFRRNTS